MGDKTPITNAYISIEESGHYIIGDLMGYTIKIPIENKHRIIESGEESKYWDSHENQDKLHKQGVIRLVYFPFLKDMDYEVIA